MTCLITIGGTIDFLKNGVMQPLGKIEVLYFFNDNETDLTIWFLRFVCGDLENIRKNEINVFQI